MTEENANWGAPCRCSQPYVSLSKLEEQILIFLSEICLPQNFHDWVLERIAQLSKHQSVERKTREDCLRKANDSVLRQLENLTKLRLRDMISDDEYLKERQDLECEKIRLEQKQKSPPYWLLCTNDRFRTDHTTAFPLLLK